MPRTPASARLWVAADGAGADQKEPSMPTAAKRPYRLTDGQLQEVLDLASHADSVELKLTVPDSERRSTVDALGMDPLEAQIRQVFFFDTPDLTLNHHGEVDAMPGGYVCSASFKSALASPQVRQVAAGDRAIRKLFSKEQRDFYAAHA